jgi:two-component system nitrate/nitrite response regulator NarL
MVRLLIVAEVKLYREGLAQVLEQRSELQVAGTAPDLDRALGVAAGVEADVVLLDVARGSALAAVRAFRQKFPRLKIVALALNDSREDEVLACIQAGISGYVPPEGSLEDLAATVERAGRGEMICPPTITAGLAKRLASLTEGGLEGLTRLTQRERQVAGLIDRGLSNKEIALALHLSIATVKHHCHHLLEKLSVHRRGEAVARLRRAIGPALYSLAVLVIGT